MAGYFTESNYENAVLQLLNEELGYNYIYGPDVERDYHSPLYEDVLLPSLQRINKSPPMDALTEAIYKLKNFETGTLLQKNMVFMDYLQNGVPVKYYDKGEERSTLVYLVDFINSCQDNNLESLESSSYGVIIAILRCPLSHRYCRAVRVPSHRSHSIIGIDLEKEKEGNGCPPF